MYGVQVRLRPTAWGAQVSPSVQPVSAGESVTISKSEPESMADRMAAISNRALQVLQETTEGLATACLTDGAQGHAAATSRIGSNDAEADLLTIGSRGSGAEPSRAQQPEGMGLGQPGSGTGQCQAVQHRHDMAPELRAWYHRCAPELGTLVSGNTSHDVFVC